ncbi:MAG: hypothetical protein M0002_11655 [Rhodospirillales bacterium]|nr:hypothetical protein [Rhodospirillales bacterium]
MLASGLFDRAALARLIDEHAAGRFDHNQPLWLLLVFAGFLASRDRRRENLALLRAAPAEALA